MKWAPKFSVGGVLNILIFSALTLGGAYLFHRSGNLTNPDSHEEIGRVIEKAGNVTVKTGKGQGWLPARELNPVYDKSSLYTGEASRASVQVRNTVIQVEEKTLIQIIDPNKQTELFMDFGALRLTAKQKEQVILNVGGERIKVSLDSSTVKIKREKKSRKLKIESLSGPVKVESLTHPQTVVAEDITFNVGTDSPLESPPEPPKPKLQLNYQSEYASDEKFSRRPVLSASVLSDVREARFEVSSSGQDWTPIKNGKFTPSQEGEYFIRAHGVYADGQVAETEPAPWNPKSEHFQLRQPALRKASFTIDPAAKPRNKPLFRAYPAALKSIEFRLNSSQTVKFAADNKFPADLIPAGAQSVRVTSYDLPFAADAEWLPLSLSVEKPNATNNNGIISVKPIRLEQYFYEAVVENENRTLEFNGRGQADAACASACTVAVRYKSRLNPQWSSAETLLKIKAPPPLRVVASEPPKEIAVEKLKLNPVEFKAGAPWIFEAGGGGNYLNMATTSSLTNATSSGFSGPGFFASGEHQMETYNLKASYLGVFTKMKNVSSTGATTQNLSWQSVWMGANQPGFWFFKRIEYGATYHEMPLFYQNASGDGQFQNASTFAGTLGFNTSYGLGKKGRIVWDQRLLVPLVARSSGSISSFSPRFGVEGNLSYYHCIADKWALGGSWLGQYWNARFSLREEPGLQAESPTTGMFNSNFQIRLQYGLCGSAPAQAN